MSAWTSRCEALLTQINTGTGIPCDFERFAPDPVTLQLPDTFITYFLVDDVGDTWADGKETSHSPRVQVSLFYRDASVFLTIPDMIKSAFMGDGFSRGDEGQIPYQQDTGHHGWRCDFYHYERR